MTRSGSCRKGQLAPTPSLRSLERTKLSVVMVTSRVKLTAHWLEERLETPPHPGVWWGLRQYAPPHEVGRYQLEVNVTAPCLAQKLLAGREAWTLRPPLGSVVEALNGLSCRFIIGLS